MTRFHPCPEVLHFGPEVEGLFVDGRRWVVPPSVRTSFLIRPSMSSLATPGTGHYPPRVSLRGGSTLRHPLDVRGRPQGSRGPSSPKVGTGECTSGAHGVGRTEPRPVPTSDFEGKLTKSPE